MAQGSNPDRQDGVDEERDDYRACWELQDSECFSVEISPWPPRAGTSTLTFPDGPKPSHIRYAVRTSPPIHEEYTDPKTQGLWPGATLVDRTPWEWLRFPPDGAGSDGSPYRASVELPAGRVWLAFSVEQQDEFGDWYGYPPLDDWVLDVSEA